MIAVYGASGFIGSHLLSTFPDMEAQDRDEIIPRHPTILFLASTVDNYNVHSNPLIDVETNEILPIRVLAEAKNKYGSEFTFNYISTWFVYGKISKPATEESDCHPTGFYSITRYAGELLVKSYCNTFGIPWRVLRLANILGVGDKKSSLKKNAIQYLIQKLAEGEKISIYKERSYRDIMDVRDCVQALNLVMKEGNLNENFNIGNGDSVDIRELVESTARSLGVPELISYMEAPSFHKEVQTDRFQMDTMKLIDLGYDRKFSLGETINWITGK